MADHHHHRRPDRISLPPRSTVFSASGSTPRSSNPLYRYPPLTPTPTPSKHRLTTARNSAFTTSFSFVFLLLFYLRSFYSLLPFLRSSPPSFSIFPFSFLVSLLSFLLTLLFSSSALIFTKNSSSQKSPRPIFSFSSVTQSHRKLLVAKSLVLAVVFLLRFQALRYCGAAAMILAELSGTLAARFVFETKDRSIVKPKLLGSSKVRGFIALFSGLLLLSLGWDHIQCFPLSSKGILALTSGNCFRIWPMLLPFLSGFLGCYERVLSNWGNVRELGRKRVRLITLFFSTAALFIPAIVSLLVFDSEGDDISLSIFNWPLAYTVVFGVLLAENSMDENVAGSRTFQRDYLVTFVCTLALELFYYPEVSLWGLLFCGFLLWISVRELDPMYLNYPELGFESSESLGKVVMKTIRHIVSERKSRRIALFLLINTAYMVFEFVAGFMSNSLGLISDACHMLFDCAALAIGLYASYISRLPANSQFNYGRGRFEVLSGYVNAVFLVLVGALITLESLERILDPQEINTDSLLGVSIGGLIVNVIGLIFFHEEHHHAHGGSGTCSHSHSDEHEESHSHHGHSLDHHIDEHHVKLEEKPRELQNVDGKHQHHHDHDHDHDHHHDHHDHHDHHHEKHEACKHEHHDHRHGHCSGDLQRRENKNHHHHIDHNMRGIFLHVLADTMGSVGVVTSTLLIKYKGWLIADPACSIFISALIVLSVIPLLTNSAEILLQRVPRSHEHDIQEALHTVMKLKGVVAIQNFHVWSFTNSEVVGTIQLHVSADSDNFQMKNHVAEILHEAGIKDLTVQVESFNFNDKEIQG